MTCASRAASCNSTASEYYESNPTGSFSDGVAPTPLKVGAQRLKTGAPCLAPGAQCLAPGAQRLETGAQRLTDITR